MAHPFRDSTNAYFYMVGDFSVPRSVINLFCLDYEIKVAGMSAIYDFAYADSADPDVGFLFTRQLTSPEKSALDDVVTNHYGDCPPKPRDGDILVYDSTAAIWDNVQPPPDRITVKDEGSLVTGTPHKTLNFVGNGVDSTNGSGGTVDIIIPGDLPHNLDDHIDVPPPPGPDMLLVFDGTSYVWQDHIAPGESIISGISFTMSDHAAHDYVGTATTSYTNIRSFVYDGTGIWTPKNFSVIASLSKTGATGSARLYDFTNNNEIAVLNWTNLNKQIITTGSLSNLSTGQSLIELQVSINANGTDARLHYMALY